LWHIQFNTIAKYVHKFKKKGVNHNRVANSQSYKFVHLLGADWAIKKNLIFKSRIEIPSIAKGGSLYRNKVSCDLVYYI
jgi:hypothetical protein